MNWIANTLRNGFGGNSLLPGSNDIRNHRFVRPGVDERFKAALDAGSHIVLYGPPQQGKTTILRHYLDQETSCIIDCRDDTKRKDIYRIMLSMIGYEVVQEIRKKGKVGVKASVKFFDTGIETGGEGEVETKVAALTADLSNANEVAKLLDRSKKIQYLVLNNFQRLKEGTKENLLLDFSVFDENSRFKFVIVGTWTDPFFLERLLASVSHRFEKIPVDHWSPAELSAYLTELNDQAAAGFSDELMKQAVELARGNIVNMNQLVHLFRQYNRDSESGVKSLRNTSFQKQAEEFFFARFSEIYIQKLRELATHRNLLVEYQAMRKVSKVVQAADPANQEEETTPGNSGENAVEAEDQEELTNYSTHLGLWFLKYMIPQVSAKNVLFPIRLISETFIKELEPKALSINPRRLRRAIQGIVELQRELLIYPEIFGISPDDSISVLDREFIRFCARTDIEELFADFDEASDSVLQLKVRRRNRLWESS